MNVAVRALVGRAGDQVREPDPGARPTAPRSRCCGDVCTFKLRDAGYTEFVTGETRFGLLEHTRASALIGREPTQGGPAGEVLFLVDDVDAEAERLRGLGVEFLSGPVDRPWGHRTLHLLDPDGFVVELAQKIPRLLPRHG